MLHKCTSRGHISVLPVQFAALQSRPALPERGWTSSPEQTSMCAHHDTPSSAQNTHKNEISLEEYNHKHIQWPQKEFAVLTANSGRFFSRFCSPPSSSVARDVRKTLEKTSNCWQAVDTLVISPWYPASEINCAQHTQTRHV